MDNPLEKCITLNCPLSKDCERHTKNPEKYSSVTLYNVEYFKAYDWYYCKHQIEKNKS